MSIAPFSPTPTIVINRMLKLANLKAGETLYDLGSGDGRILIVAAKDFKSRAVGIEIREDLVLEAQKRIQELNLREWVKIIQGSILEVDISEADVVTLYLTTSANERIKPKLERELKHGARVVSHDFEIHGWKPIRVEEVVESGETWPSHHTIYLYKRP